MGLKRALPMTACWLVVELGVPLGAQTGRRALSFRHFTMGDQTTNWRHVETCTMLLFLALELFEDLFHEASPILWVAAGHDQARRDGRLVDIDGAGPFQRGDMH